MTAVKRTSLYLRNPANAPDAADRAALDKIYFALRAGEAPPKLIFQKVETPGAATEWRLYRPVVTLPSCVQCHGPADQVSSAVRVALQRRFPEDQAVGIMPPVSGADCFGCRSRPRRSPPSLRPRRPGNNFRSTRASPAAGRDF